MLCEADRRDENHNDGNPGHSYDSPKYGTGRGSTDAISDFTNEELRPALIHAFRLPRLARGARPSTLPILVGCISFLLRIANPRTGLGRARENSLRHPCGVISAQGSFDSAVTSLREVAAALKMTILGKRLKPCPSRSWIRRVFRSAEALRHPKSRAAINP
jgi:hypothetical protein